ncbi:MAG: hypothetical protein B6242_10360 [Anaerolineaceae bacterium 4572_78]|nr:MAG: hypothetical protein B6242_10360 [Anaerolineaceae bacterium 4572_78]
MGAFVIPARKRQAKAELSTKLATLRGELLGSLTKQFDKELNRSLQRIKDATNPYTRFIRSERDKLDDLKVALTDSQYIQEQLRAKIESL